MSDYIIPLKYVYFSKNLTNVLPNGILRDSRQTVFFLSIGANHLFPQKITVSINSCTQMHRAWGSNWAMISLGLWGCGGIAQWPGGVRDGYKLIGNDWAG